MNAPLKWARNTALALLVAGVTYAQPWPGGVPTPQVVPTSADSPGSEPAPNRSVSRDDWIVFFRAQPGHPSPEARLALLPEGSMGGTGWLLLQGGAPGQLARVDLESRAHAPGMDSGIVGAYWARFDGAGQARIRLATAMTGGVQLQLWVAGSQGTWWPGPRLSVNLAGRRADASVSVPRPVQTGELVICEIMKDPAAVPDGSGEWFELFNTTWMRQDIAGFTLSDDTGAGTILDNGGEPIWVPGRGYRVLARDGESANNGGIDGAHDYGSFTLRNGADQIILARPDGTVVDRVSYDDGPAWPDVSGASMQLSPGLESPYLNDIGASWCESYAPFGAGDLGTPGLANEDC